MANTSGASAPPQVSTATRWIAWLFMIGSACFAAASIPALAEAVPAAVIGVTYFVGSIFFTSAATVVVVTSWGHARRAAVPHPLASNADWWASLIQWVGTLWFNINTYDAMAANLTTQEKNLRIWTPDMIGSICFLVASYIWLWLACHRPWCICRDDRDWQIAALNLLGSVFFMLSALAAFTRPATDNLLDASLANSGTLLGALCFLVGARLLLPPRARA